MRHSSRAGISEAVVVIFVFLALALLAPAVVCYNLIDAKTNIHKDLHEKIEAEGAEGGKQTQLIQRMRDAVETGATGFDPQPEATYMPDRTKAAMDAAAAFLAGGEGGDVWGDFVAEVKRADPNWEAPETRPANLQQMATFMIPFVNDMSLDERVSQTPEQTAAKAVTTAGAIGGTLRRPYDEIQTGITEKDRDVSTAQQEETRVYDQEIARIGQDIATVTQQIEDVKLKGRLFDRKTTNEIYKLTGQLEEFKRKEAVNFARIRDVGEIFNTSTDGKTAHTKLGSRDGVVVGMHFHVGNKGRHENVEPKGRVQVRRVWPEMAELEVVSLRHERSPILTGDLLVNPFFRPGRPVIVQILGPERAPGVMGKLDAIGRIEEMGGVVRAAYSTDVDFVITMGEEIASADDIEALRLARRMDVPVYRAADLFDYLED